MGNVSNHSFPVEENQYEYPDHISSAPSGEGRLNHAYLHSSSFTEPNHFKMQDLRGASNSSSAGDHRVASSNGSVISLPQRAPRQPPIQQDNDTFFI